MNKINFHIQFKKNNNEWTPVLQKKQEFIEMAIEKYVHSDIEGFTLDCSGKLLSGAKTTSQLGYLHAEILQKALFGYRNLGWNIVNTKQTSDLLKHEIGFYDIIENPVTGECRKQLRSFATSTKEDTRLAIDAMIIFIESELGVEVESPEDYKIRMGIKDFTK